MPANGGDIPRPLLITELCLAILQEVEDPKDLVSMACTARRFTELCLQILWAAPDFNGAALVSMLHLFPGPIREQLQRSGDPHLRVPRESFQRFDYYAAFIRTLTLWHHGQEEYLTRVLTASRPNVWLFPALEELHLGASGEDLRSVPDLLSPSLRSLRLNHWTLQPPMVVTPSHPIKRTLLHVCRLPLLETLDLMDTRYVDFEEDREIVHGFVNLAHQLHEIRAYSFVPLPPIFTALSRNTKLRLLCLNLEESDGRYVPLTDMLDTLRHAFPALKTLCLLSNVEHATFALQRIGRRLEGLDLRIEEEVAASHLYDLVNTIIEETPTSKKFCLSADHTMFCDIDPPLRVSEVFHPFIAITDLRHLQITLGFHGEQIIRDAEMNVLLSQWPNLQKLIIESDPNDASLPCDEQIPDFGLTLEAIAAAASWCRRLCQLRLPYMNTIRIPDITGIPKAYHRFSMQINRSHIHNRAALVTFVSSLWPNCTIHMGGCNHPDAASAP